MHGRYGPLGEPARQGHSVCQCWSLFRCLTSLCALILSSSQLLQRMGFWCTPTMRWTWGGAVQGACQLCAATSFDLLTICAVVTGRQPVPVPGFDPQALGHPRLGVTFRTPAASRMPLVGSGGACCCCVLQVSHPHEGPRPRTALWTRRS